MNREEYALKKAFCDAGAAVSAELFGPERFIVFLPITEVKHMYVTPEQNLRD
jgi:hypothetical protein